MMLYEITPIFSRTIAFLDIENDTGIYIDEQTEQSERHYDILFRVSYAKDKCRSLYGAYDGKDGYHYYLNYLHCNLSSNDLKDWIDIGYIALPYKDRTVRDAFGEALDDSPNPQPLHDIISQIPNDRWQYYSIDAHNDVAMYNKLTPQGARRPYALILPNPFNIDTKIEYDIKMVVKHTDNDEQEPSVGIYQKERYAWHQEVNTSVW